MTSGGSRPSAPAAGPLAVMLLSALVFLLSMFYRGSVALIAPDLQRDLGLGLEDLGVLGAAFFYVFALAQVPVGPWLDRFGPRLTMATLNVVGALGALVFALSGSLAVGALGRGLLGLGMSANLIGPLRLFIDWFPAHRFATIMGAFTAVGTLGGMMAATPMAWLVHQLGWRGTFGLLAGLNLILSLGVLRFVADRPPRPDQIAAPAGTGRGMAARSLARLALSREYWIISLAAFTRYGAVAAVQTLWIGPFLIDHLGLDVFLAGNLLLVLNLGLGLGGPAGGWVSDTLLGTRRAAVMAGLAGMAATLLLLGLWPGGREPVALAVLLFLLGLLAQFGNLFYPHIKELMPHEMSATAMSAVNLFTMLGAGVFIHGLGGLLEMGDPGRWLGLGAYETAFVVCGLVVALSAGLYYFTRESPETTGPPPGGRKEE